VTYEVVPEAGASFEKPGERWIEWPVSPGSLIYMSCNGYSHGEHVGCGLYISYNIINDAYNVYFNIF